MENAHYSYITFFGFQKETKEKVKNWLNNQDLKKVEVINITSEEGGITIWFKEILEDSKQNEQGDEK